MLPKGYKLGIPVICTGYIKKSGNYFLKDESDSDYIEAELRTPELDKQCLEAEKNHTEIPTGEIVEDYLTTNCYEVVHKTFSGVCVGETVRSTELTCTYESGLNGKEYLGFRKEKPELFYVVYYANNRKRLVPKDMCEPLHNE